MDPQFWHARWANGQIGFHQSEVNRYLRELWPLPGVEADAPVFVPLCGKSLDLIWLAERGHAVTGIEVSETAVAALFAENDLVPQRRPLGPFTEYRTGRLRVLCGDFFALVPEDLDGIAAAYDRGALIALPPAMRRQYVDRMAALLAVGTPTLLITLDYPATEMQGPPFAVTTQEVGELYGALFEVELVSENDVLDERPRWREQGLTRLIERVYFLRRR